MASENDKKTMWYRYQVGGVKVVGGEEHIYFEIWLFTDTGVIQDASKSVPSWWENFV